VKHPFPRKTTGSLTLPGCPRRESGEIDPGTHEVRVHAVQLGGRSRSDASRVFFSGRSQGLLVNEGASWEEVRSSTDAGHGWAEGETVRVREVANKLPRVRPAGLGLQALDTTEGVLGLLPALLSPARRSRVLWLPGQHHLSALWSQGRNTDAGQRIGRIRIPTRPCLGATTGTSEVDVVR
jgi:hypothetical protein